MLCRIRIPFGRKCQLHPRAHARIHIDVEAMMTIRTVAMESARGPKNGRTKDPGRILR